MKERVNVHLNIKLPIPSINYSNVTVGVSFSRSDERLDVLETKKELDKLVKELLEEYKNKLLEGADMITKECIQAKVWEETKKYKEEIRLLKERLLEIKSNKKLVN